MAASGWLVVVDGGGWWWMIVDGCQWYACEYMLVFRC